MLNIANVILGAFGRFRSSRDGVFSIAVALGMVMLLCAVAVALNTTRLLNAKTSMQDVLDAATLAAAHAKTKDEAEKVIDNHIARFVATNEKVSGYKVKVLSFNVNEVATEAYGTVPMLISPIFSAENVDVAVRSTVDRGSAGSGGPGGSGGSGTGTYREVIMAVDMSSSLGVAATPEDRKALGDLTLPYVQAWGWYGYGNSMPNGCAFACHRSEGWEPNGKTVYQMAKEAGIKLREDELLRQFGGLVDLLLGDGKIKISVIGFSNWADLLISKSQTANAIKDSLDNFADNARFETYFWQAFAKINEVAGTQGDGTQLNPIKTVVLITDGIESRDAFNAQRPIDVDLCTNLKSKGIEIAVVELQYPVLEENLLYDDTVGPVAGQISPAMRSCASPGWYFLAEGNSDVLVKFEELKSKLAARTVRLTQ